MLQGAGPLRDRDFSRLQGGELPLKELYAEAEGMGFSRKTLERAMSELYQNKLAKSQPSGGNANRRWIVRLLPGEETEMGENGANR